MMLSAFLHVGEFRGGRTARTHPSGGARAKLFLARISEIGDPVMRAAWEGGAVRALDTIAGLGRRDTDFAMFSALGDPEAEAEAERERQDCIDVFEVIQTDLAPFAILPLGHPHQGALLPLFETPSAPSLALPKQGRENG